MDFGTHMPQKKHFKFNEVSSLTEVKPYVLRFWETEFEQISPMINESGQKLYDTSDLLVVKLIKKLLFEDKLSIPEAKKIIDDELQAIEEELDSSVEAKLERDEANDSLLRSRQEQLEHALSGDADGFVSKAGPLSRHVQARPATSESLASGVQTGRSALNERQVVKLVSAKKKLCSLLSKIAQLEEKYHWN